MIAELSYAKIVLGQTAEFSVTITESLVTEFTTVSGDISPLHVSDEYAVTTPFGKRVVHGLLIGSFFSRLVGVHLPGKFAVYLGQTLSFHKPVYIGDTVTIVGTVIQKHDSVQVIEIKTEAAVRGEVVVSGVAKVKVLN